MSDKNPKKKVIVSKSRLKDLEGFEDLIEEFYDDVDVRKSTSKDQRINDFETLNFLENENLRLEKVNIAFNNKISNYINHPQSDALNEIQEKKIYHSEEELFTLLGDDHSALQQNLSRLLNGLK